MKFEGNRKTKREENIGIEQALCRIMYYIKQVSYALFSILSNN